MGDSFSSFFGDDGDGQTDRLEDAYQRGYDDYITASGPKSTSDDYYNASNLNKAYVMGWNQKYDDLLAAEGFKLPKINTEGFMSSYIASLKKQREEARIAQGNKDRDTYYSNRMDAAEASLAYVNNQIAEERSNAALFGLEYDISQEQKQKRVDDYFATVWSEGDETKLGELMEEFGAPEGHTEFIVNRGDASSYSSTPGSQTTVSTSKGFKPQGQKTIVDDDEEALGGAASILGG